MKFEMKMMKMIMLVGIETGKSSPIKINFGFDFLPILCLVIHVNVERDGRGDALRETGPTEMFRDESCLGPSALCPCGACGTPLKEVLFREGSRGGCVPATPLISPGQWLAGPVQPPDTLSLPNVKKIKLPLRK